METVTVSDVITEAEDRTNSSVEPVNSDVLPHHSDRGPWSTAANAIAPTAANVARVFPFSLCNAIVKNEWCMAMIEMSVANNLTIDNQMTLQILPTRAEYLAKELFGVHLMVEDHLDWDGQGTGMTHYDSMFVYGAKMERLEGIFGPLTRAAVETSSMRALEMNTGRLNRTRCIFMLVSVSSNEPVVLAITLGLEGSMKIKQLLFQL